MTKFDRISNYEKQNLILRLAVRNGIRIANVNSAVRQYRAEKSANDPLGLVRSSYVAIANVENDQRLNPS